MGIMKISQAQPEKESRNLPNNNEQIEILQKLAKNSNDKVRQSKIEDKNQKNHQKETKMRI